MASKKKLKETDDMFILRFAAFILWSIVTDYMDPKEFYYKAVKSHLWFSGSRKQLKQNYRDQT